MEVSAMENKKHPHSNCFAESITVSESPNVNLTPVNTIKVPVVLFEPEVQICVESNIWLDRPALEIKRVLKDAYIDQCRLVATTIDAATNTVLTGKLFLFGHIRKNIEFAAVHPGEKPEHHEPRVPRKNVEFAAVHPEEKPEHHESCLHGEIRHNTVCIDFEACTAIDFSNSCFRPTLAPVVQQSFEFLDKKNDSKPDLHNKQFHNEVVYNEQPYCELISARFDEIDLGFRKRQHSHKKDCHEELYKKSPGRLFSSDCDLDKTFQAIQEKIVLHVTLKLLQVQQICIAQP
jgi:hypothetical protein